MVMITCPVERVVNPDVFHLSSLSPRTSRWYRSNSLATWAVLAVSHSVRMFQIPIPKTCLGNRRSMFFFLHGRGACPTPNPPPFSSGLGTRRRHKVLTKILLWEGEGLDHDYVTRNRGGLLMKNDYKARGVLKKGH